MMSREHMLFLTATILSILFAASTPAFGQWIHYEKKNVPRLPDGKVNMTAPAPKQADGTPDLSGIWLGDNWGPAGARPNPPSRNVQTSKMLPAAQKEFDARMANNMLNDPKVRRQLDDQTREAYIELVHGADVTRIDRGETKSVRLLLEVTPEMLKAARFSTPASEPQPTRQEEAPAKSEKKLQLRSRP